MDGTSEDFSGLPPRRRDEPEYGRGTRSQRRRSYRLVVVSALVAAVGLTLLGLIVFLAPAPYLGMSHAALAASVDDSSAKGCKPEGRGWACWRTIDGTGHRYRVTADWAGCWTGKLAGHRSQSSPAPSRITGCVTVADHLRAE